MQIAEPLAAADLVVEVLLGPGRKNDGAALTQADAAMAGAFAETAEDNLVAVGEKGAGFARWKGKRLDAVAGELEQAPCGGELRTGDGAGSKKVAYL